jgi:hypothetical protein
MHAAMFKRLNKHVFALQVVIDYPTPAALSQYITKQLLTTITAISAPAAAAAVARSSPPTILATQLQPGGLLPYTAAAAAQSDALVVLATAARSPVAVMAAAAGHDPVGLVPLERWDIEADPASSSSAR